MDYDNLTDEEIRQKLVAAGVSVGPIVASTRPVYIKKLRRLAGEEPTSPPSAVRPDPVRVEEDDELPEMEVSPKKVTPLRSERPMSARPRKPLYDETSGDDLRHRKPSPKKKLDVKMERQMEASGGGWLGFIAKLIAFLALFALTYFLLTLYMTDGKQSNLITGSD